MKTELPRWFCRDAKDRDRLEAWTVAALDKITKPTADDIQRELDPIDLKFATAVEQGLKQQLKRGRVIIAARAKDSEALARLADTEALRRLAFKPHKQGREKGERRPRDHRPVLKVILEDAANDVDLIRDLWARHYQRRNRTIEPTATAIAARRYGIDETALILFMKNRHRS